MKEIQLTKGKTALVDDCDYDNIVKYKWCATPHKNGRWYANAWVCGRKTLMHRLILGIDISGDIDHRDGDGLNNRRYNLRQATRAQNNANQQVTPHTSKFKGVCWDKNRGKWSAKIKVDGIIRNLGRYDREEDAGHAYDIAAFNVFGEFARLNGV